MLLDFDSKVLKDTLKYIIPFVTVLSVVKQTIFYWMFDINIWNYAEIQEVLSPFIKDLLFYCIFFLIPFLLVILFKGNEIGKSNVNKFALRRQKTFFKRFLSTLYNDIFFLSNIIFIPLYIYKGDSFLEIFIKIGLSLSFFVFFYLREEFIITNNVELTLRTVTILNILNIIFLITVLNIWDGINKAYKIKNTIGNEVILITEEKPIYCKYTLNYIGRTKNYTFIYNKDKERTEVIENSRIKKEMFKLSK